MDGLVDDTLSHICTFLSARDVYILALVCPSMHKHVKRYKLLLRAFQRVFEKRVPFTDIAPAVFTGSCVLQSLLNEQWEGSDIDIFTSDLLSSRKLIEQITNVWNGHITRITPDDHGHDAYDGSISRNKYAINKHMFDIVLTTLPVNEKIATFDLSCCKCTYDGNCLVIEQPFNTMVLRQTSVFPVHAGDITEYHEIHGNRLPDRHCLCNNRGVTLRRRCKYRRRGFEFI
jgi:hypothetical protein